MGKSTYEQMQDSMEAMRGQTVCGLTLIDDGEFHIDGTPERRVEEEVELLC
jgi:hypothetical protein